LGAPEKQVDFIAEQTRSQSVVPAAGPGELPVSPQPLRTRGKTTHPLGNRDVSWQWKSAAFPVELIASINGDGTVETLFGQLGAPLTSTGDPAAEWRAFDTQANAQGASYFSALHPSTVSKETLSRLTSPKKGRRAA
jgi:urease accessory protein UreE